MGECTRIWCISPSSNDLLLSKQFSSKGKSLNPSGEIWKSTRLYWRDLVTVCRQKKAEKRHFLSDWPKRGLASFLNTVQLHPLWVKLYQLDREDQALLVGLPVGEGDALWAELCEGPFGQWSQSSSCRKSWKFIWVGGLINFVGSHYRAEELSWINGKKEPICQELHLQLF